MSEPTSETPEPRHDIAHLSHVELLTPRPEESLAFFRDVLGMHEVARHGQSVYLRAWGEYELCSLKLTESAQPGIGHTAFRADSPQALGRLVQTIEASGRGQGWIEGDTGHGKAFQFTDPDGHLLEIYYETEKYRAPENQRPALKNQPQRTSDRGIGVRRLDHVNFLGRAPATNSDFLHERLGARLTEHIVLDDGTQAGVWLTFTNKAYDVVYRPDRRAACTTSPIGSIIVRTCCGRRISTSSMASPSNSPLASTPSRRASSSTRANPAAIASRSRPVATSSSILIGSQWSGLRRIAPKGRPGEPPLSPVFIPMGRRWSRPPHRKIRPMASRESLQYRGATSHDADR